MIAIALDNLILNNSSDWQFNTYMYEFGNGGVKLCIIFSFNKLKVSN